MSRLSFSVIIPSVSNQRGDMLRLLVKDIENQTLRPHELHVIKGVFPSGRARNMGARRTSSDVLVFLDDDVRLGNETVLEAMVGSLADTQIGMAGAAQLLPRDSSAFQRAAGHQIPRSCSSVVSDITESDMVTTACCAIRRSLFWELGGFDEYIPRGVDPEMRHRIRSRGFRIVVAPNTWFYHPMPATLSMLCRTFFRNGRHSAEAIWWLPSAALENPDGHVVRFVAIRSTPYRAGRHLGRILLGLLTLRWIGIIAQIAYIAGYLWRWVQLRREGACLLGTGTIERMPKS